MDYGLWTTYATVDLPAFPFFHTGLPLLSHRPSSSFSQIVEGADPDTIALADKLDPTLKRKNLAGKQHMNTSKYP
jgi:hypothetical protein